MKTKQLCPRIGHVALSLVLSGLLAASSASGQGGGELHPELKIPAEPLKRWRELRVGTFIHWSPYVLQGIGDPKDFRAEAFNPDEWVRLFKEAGFKYVVFTTKHGDAVCMWDTKESKLNVMNTPMKRDVVGELVAACRAGGVEFCPYYALENYLHPDWTSDLDPKTGAPDFSKRRQTSWSKQGLATSAYDVPPDAAPDFERYIKHLKAQLKELTVKYGPFLAWWYDQRAPSWDQAHGSDLYAYMRSLQPDVLQSHRVDTCYDRGLDNPTWFVTEGKFAGDYALSEISIPRFNREIAWEYCRVAGIEGTSWYWKPNDVYRPVNEWIMDIVNAACRDGNFLLGIGPTHQGRFEPRLVDQLRQLGLWLQHNGDSIYCTRGGPFKPNTWYGSTCKSNTVYVHIFKTDTNNSLTLPALNKRIVKSRLLNGGDLKVEQTDKNITLKVGKYDLQPVDTIAELELDGSAEDIVPVEELNLVQAAKVMASSSRNEGGRFLPEKTIDQDRKSFWTTEAGVTEGWLEYDLGGPKTFSRAILDEGDDGWIRHVQIEIKANGVWQKAFEYRHGNPELWKAIPMELFAPEFKFAPVTAQFVRIKILSAIHSPVIRELKLYVR